MSERYYDFHEMNFEDDFVEYAQELNRQIPGGWMAKKMVHEINEELEEMRHFGECHPQDGPPAKKVDGDDFCNNFRLDMRECRQNPQNCLDKLNYCLAEVAMGNGPKWEMTKDEFNEMCPQYAYDSYNTGDVFEMVTGMVRNVGQVTV